MDASTLRDWLLPASSCITLITASVGGWLALREFRLKVKAETPIANSTQLESDIKLPKLFTEIMTIAHARGDSYVSEKAIETILSPEGRKELNISISDVASAIHASVVSLPIGAAAQDSAICAIWVLGNTHEILKPVAIQALESLSAFKAKVATPYLEDLKSGYTGRVVASAEREKGPFTEAPPGPQPVQPAPERQERQPIKSSALGARRRPGRPSCGRR
jgi:hypothetical protein